METPPIVSVRVLLEKSQQGEETHLNPAFTTMMDCKLDYLSFL